VNAKTPRRQGKKEERGIDRYQNKEDGASDAPSSVLSVPGVLPWRLGALAFIFNRQA
jgi:hypothetical protein